MIESIVYRVHRKAIMGKLNTRSVAALVQLSYEAGVRIPSSTYP